jgi:hypothetical protein
MTNTPKPQKPTIVLNARYSAMTSGKPSGQSNVAKYLQNTNDRTSRKRGAARNGR